KKYVYIKINNDNLPPQLVVRDGKTNPSIVKSGDNFSVAFDVWNMGTIEAKNVTIDIDSGDSFFILDNVTKQYLFELKGLNNRQITYNLKGKEDLKTGTYPVTISLGHEAVAKTDYTLYVSVEAEEDEEEEDNIDIITENVNTPHEAVKTQTPFSVSFDVKNIGLTQAKEVKVSVDAGDKILPKSLNVLTINTLEPGQSKPVSFSFIASKDSESRSYPIKAIIEYKNGEEQVKKEQYMGVLIEGEEEKDEMLNTVPKIIISEYSSDPGMVKAGENFALHMAFLNTSKVKSIQNMKITLVVDEGSEETGGSVFTPVQSSNTFYIDKLESGQTSQKEMIMYTIPDAKAKTYVVKAMFEYEYEEQGQLKTNSMEDLFGIPVIQSAKLEVTDVIVSEPAFVGEPVYVSSEFYNTGRVKLSNLMIKVEGDFDTRESNYFVGNFEIGSGDYYDASITPLQPGESSGVLVYTFEDAAGEEHRIETEFTVNAMESQPVMNPFPGEMFPDDSGMYPGMEDESSKFPLIPAIIGGVVLVGVIVLIIVLKRRKKRKELMLDEDI
ncbi:MAG TPA: CARDB domain-containing protein, partial [Thermoclostridium sp.]|nr:CARDB domain-containing protein [Thermoclostridium sp.]